MNQNKQILNIFDNIKIILKLYESMAVSNKSYFDLVYNNKKLIFNNLVEFINITNNNILQASFIRLLKPI